MQSPRSAFEKISSLAGRWRGTSSGGKMITIQYESTGKNSAVIERYRHHWKGETMANEMITMYHLDGDQLVLTHYCTIGNQPHMRADLSHDSDIVFEYVGASNLAHPDSLRMNGLKFEFVDADHIVQTWSWEGDKRYLKPENRSCDFLDLPDIGSGTDRFDLERVAFGGYSELPMKFDGMARNGVMA